MKSKTISTIILVLITCVLVCVGCKGKFETVGKQEYTEPSGNQFDAKILEIHDDVVATADECHRKNKNYRKLVELLALSLDEC